jgi:peptidoglycan/xylan/chitin deacetylase (PgdA/CDA1 family)
MRREPDGPSLAVAGAAMTRIARIILAPLAAIALSTAVGGCIAGADGAATDDESMAQAPGGKADSLFGDGPLYLTGGFDGSKRFGMWVDTLEFARHIGRDYGKRLRFTYFINSCYLDETTTGSAIGRAITRDEAIVRIALIQQTINEGHEIGNHTVRHRDGGSWSVAQWRAELADFHRITDKTLFNSIQEADGSFAFPRWSAMPDAAARKVGASCSSNADCDSNQCLPVSDKASFCTAGCNQSRPCPNGTVCGSADWVDSQDVCVPMPEFPVSYQGKVLFDESGNANLAHPALKPYRMSGFRAPELAHNAATFDALQELGYRYDTSKILQPGPPARVVHSGKMWSSLYELPLMKNPGSLTVPMDYNYLVNNGSGDRMLADYQRSIVDAYNVRERQPWNIGHHFSLWQGGAYWTAMKGAFEYAAQGCPAGNGQLQCENVEFPSFAGLVQLLESKGDGVSDPFADPTVEQGEELDVPVADAENEES